MKGILPRGIQEVKWKNKDKTRSIRFRVRIKRNDFEIDRLFDDLAEAEEFLAKSKSAAGRRQLVEDEAKRQSDHAELSAFFSQPTLGKLIDTYIEDRIPELPDSAPETKKRSRKARISRLNSIKSAMAPAVPAFWQKAKLAEVAFPIIVSHPTKPLGDIKLEEISENFGTEYIKARLKTHGPSTVAREVGCKWRGIGSQRGGAKGSQSIA